MTFAKRLAAAAVFMLLAGCGPTWSTTSLKTAPDAMAATGDTRAPTEIGAILVTQDDIADRPYTVLGDLEVTVNKMTLLHPDPTRESIDAELREEAAKIGADAVILVRYGTVGISFVSWGSLDGQGRAVAFTD